MTTIPKACKMCATPYGLFITGGVDQNDKILKNVIILQIKDQKEQDMYLKTIMLHHHASHIALYRNTFIYIISGFGAQGWSQYCELYNCETQKWFQLPDIITPVVHSSGVIYQDYVYVFGGQLRNGEPSNQIQKYDTLNQNWKIIDLTLPAPSYYQMISLLNPEELLIAGGFQCLDQAWTVSLKEEKIMDELEGPGAVFLFQPIRYMGRIYGFSRMLIYIFDGEYRTWHLSKVKAE